MSALVADFGGTRLKARVVGATGMVDSFVVDASEKSLLEKQLQVIKEMIADFACALPGIVEPDGEKVVQVFSRYDDALDFSVSDWTQKELGLLALIENDARAAAVGNEAALTGLGYLCQQRF